MPTHEVTNQAPPLEGYNAYDSDPVLVGTLRRESAEWGVDAARTLGAFVGSADGQRIGREANENPPILHTHDRYGNRLDEVRFHPAWHELLALSTAHGLHSLPWIDSRPEAQLVRAVAGFLLGQVDEGHGCPITMTYAGVPALRAAPRLAAEWEPRLTSRRYDARFIPAKEKHGALMGMAMTEKQGGSDVRANTTIATRMNGDAYSITGHKWFCSAPMCDAFLMLAQAKEGLTCFLMPRFLPDGTKNAMHFQRLKAKLGNWSNASSEVEFQDAFAERVGEEGRGVPTIITMVNHTRLDCVIGSAGTMRQAVAQALHHASHRSAFGKLLVDQPLMRNVLADLAIESEAATLTALYLAKNFGDVRDEGELLRRALTPIAKYWVCKRGPMLAAEAIEVLGGNGYVEVSGMPRLYRDSPLNSIWEGSGNVMCLDVLRVLYKSPEALDAFVTECARAKGGDARFDRELSAVSDEVRSLLGQEAEARRNVERLALLFQGSLLLRYGAPAVADAFCQSRLGGDWGRVFGTLPSGCDFAGIVSRHRP